MDCNNEAEQRLKTDANIKYGHTVGASLDNLDVGISETSIGLFSSVKNTPIATTIPRIEKKIKGANADIRYKYPPKSGPTNVPKRKFDSNLANFLVLLLLGVISAM